MALRIADVAKEVKGLEEDKNQLVAHVNELAGKFNHCWLLILRVTFYCRGL